MITLHFCFVLVLYLLHVFLELFPDIDETELEGEICTEDEQQVSGELESLRL